MSEFVVAIETHDIETKEQATILAEYLIRTYLSPLPNTFVTITEKRNLDPNRKSVKSYAPSETRKIRETWEQLGYVYPSPFEEISNAR